MLLSVAIACVVTQISQAEARDLAIEVGKAEAYSSVKVDAMPSQPTGRPDAWTFRVYAANAVSLSDLIGWVSVNKTTGQISDPVTFQPHQHSEAVENAARQIKAAHCIR